MFQKTISILNDGKFEGDCFSQLQQLVNFFISNSDQLLALYRFSGKSYNDFGRYKDCVSNPNFNYLLATVSQGKRLPNPLSMGLCLPAACKDSDLNSFKPYLVPIINQELKSAFKDVEGLGLADLILENDDINFVNSAKLNDQVRNFKFSNFAFIAITIFLILLTIFGTLYSQRKMKSRKNDAIEKHNKYLLEKETSQTMLKDNKKQISIEDNKLKKIKINIKEMSKLEKICWAFSLRRNLKKLFSERTYNQADNEFEIFNAFKLFGIFLVVSGNTYYYTFKGPLQNLEIISTFLKSIQALFVLQSDLQVDIFYWISAFVMSYNLLKKLLANGSVFHIHPVKFIGERLLRMLPLYIFLIFFLWQFMSLIGGEGPMFYQFEQQHGCENTWLAHLFMINNFYPYGQPDYCIEPSWYLANDFWFMCICVFLTPLYLRNQKCFYQWVILLSVLTTTIQIIQISTSNFSASFLDRNDNYWTEYYRMPQSRFHCWLIGHIFGCWYFSYKNSIASSGRPGIDFIEKKVESGFNVLKNQNTTSLLCGLLGGVLQLLAMIFSKIIHERPNGVQLGWNITYLLFARPLYTIGFTLSMLPMLLKNESSGMVRKLLSHRYLVPYAKLTFGVFLNHSIFMQYRISNLEQGLWVQMFETNLTTLAYFTFCLIFSLLTYLIIEAPFANILNDFIRSKRSKDVIPTDTTHYQSQSAKAYLRAKKQQSPKSKKGKDLEKNKSTSIQEEEGEEYEDA